MYNFVSKLEADAEITVCLFNETKVLVMENDEALREYGFFIPQMLNCCKREGTQGTARGVKFVSASVKWW